MPYRRLPNTDRSRLKALQTANEKATELSPVELPFSQKTAQKVKYFLPDFERIINQKNYSKDQHLNKCREFKKYKERAKTYISHFFQVMNLAIQRGDLPKNTREYFDIDINDSKVPNLIKAEEIINWGKKIIDGEAQRLKEGVNPITNPTNAVVRVHYEKFADSYREHQSLNNTEDYSKELIDKKRKNADEIIVDLWNEIEETFKDQEAEEKRKNSAEFGIKYYDRKKKEKKQEEKESNKVEKPASNKKLQYSFFF